MKIKCPTCGAVGTDVEPYPEDLGGPHLKGEEDYAFAVHGREGGRAVRKCLNCGAGVYVKLLPPRYRAIPPDRWELMQEYFKVHTAEVDARLDDVVARIRDEQDSGSDNGKETHLSESGQSGLDQYFKETGRPSAEISEVAQRVEQIFSDLNLPWSRSGDSWAIEADVGRVIAGLDEDQDVLTIWQSINELKGKPKNNADFLYALLCNNTVGGSWFAVMESDDGTPPVVCIVSRLSAKTLDKEEVEMALESLFAKSKLFD